jgi:hypothetical protein
MPPRQNLGETFLRKLLIDRPLDVLVSQLVARAASNVNPSVGLESGKIGVPVVVVADFLAECAGNEPRERQNWHDSQVWVH